MPYLSLPMCAGLRTKQTTAETIPRRTYVPESLDGFLGVNLRRDPMNLRDQDVARALNWDFHSLVGSPALRAGH